jgi:uncharacterized protein involved in outer membrane biogenesis
MDKKIKYLIIVSGLALFVWLGLIVAFNILVDSDKLRAKIEKDVNDFTGYNLNIKRVSSSFIFIPKIFLYDGLVRGSKSPSSQRIAAFSNVEIHINIFSIFSETPQISNILIDGSSIEIEETAKNKYNIPVPKSNLKDFFNNPSVPSISIRGARLNYTPFQSQNTYEMRGIDVDLLVSSDQIDLIGGLKINNIDYDVELSFNQNGDIIKTDALFARENSSDEQLKYSGELQYKQNELTANGTLDVAVAKISNWTPFLDLDGSKEKLYNFLQDFKAKGKLKIDLNNQENGYKLDIKSDGFTLNDGNLELNYSFNNYKTPSFKADLKLSDLIFTKLAGTNNQNRIFNVLNKLLSQQIQGEVDLRIANLEIGEYNATDLELDSNIVDGELVINKFLVKMGGKTNIFVFAIARKDLSDFINVDGSLEILGEDFTDFADSIKLNHGQFLKGSDGKFRAKSNILISPELNLFSNAKLNVGNFYADGNIEYRPKAAENYNITLSIANANLDGFTKYINPISNQEGLEKGYDVPRIYIPWLHEIDETYKINLILKNFILFDEQGGASKLTLEASTDRLEFSEIDFNWREMSITGELNMSQYSNSPIFDCNLYVSEFDLGNIVGGNFRELNVKRGNLISIWDDKPFDIDFMRGYGGNFNIRAGVLRHNSFVVRDANFSAQIDAGVWKIAELGGAIWGGSFNTKGEIDVSSVPAAELDFLFKGVMIEELLNSTIDISPMSGRVNLYGDLVTGGISITNLIDGLRGQVVISGRDINIKGFDMAGMLQALPAVRNINDVANTVRISLLGGKTSFSTLEGAFYLDGGMLKSHGIKLRSKHAIGTIVGESNLITWDMNYRLDFKLPTLSTTEVAEISLFFKESMDDPMVSVDSRNLESFIAKRKSLR